MAHIRQILANLSISVSDFKKSPKTVIKAAKNEPIAVIIDNKPAFYCVPADILESLYQKVYEMNDMALQNIERLDSDVSSSLSEPPADYDFGVNDVFEAIEDEHEAKRTIHNDSLVDPLNNQVADPLDEEVAHQINLSIDQHLKSLKEKEMYEDTDEDEKEISTDDDTKTFIKQAASSNRPNETSILDKINNLDPSLANDFAYPYAQTSDMPLGIDSTDHSAMSTANQESSFEGLEDLDLTQSENKEAALTDSGAKTLDEEFNAQNVKASDTKLAAQANLSSSASYKALSTKRKSSSKSTTKATVKTTDKSANKATAKSETKPTTKAKAKTTAKSIAKPASKTTAKSAAKARTSIKSVDKSLDNSQVDLASDIADTLEDQTTKSVVKSASRASTSGHRRKKNTLISAQQPAASNLHDANLQQQTPAMQNNIFDAQTNVPEQQHSDFLNAEFSEDKGFAHTNEYELLNDSDIDLSGNDDADIASEFDIMDDSSSKHQSLDAPNFISDNLLNSTVEQEFLSSTLLGDEKESSGNQNFSSFKTMDDSSANDDIFDSQMLETAEQHHIISAQNKQLEDKAALRAIISDVKQEIRESEHAKHLVSTPYDMTLEQVARTYSPYQGKIRKSKLTTEENVDPDKTLKALVKPPKSSRSSKDKNRSESSLKSSKASKSAKDKTKASVKDGAKESKKDLVGKLSKAKDSKYKDGKVKHKDLDDSCQLQALDNKKNRKSPKAKRSGHLTSDMHSAAKRAREIIAQVESKD